MRDVGTGKTLVLALCCLAALASAFLPMRTDDMYIYFRYARHLAGGEGFCFNPGEQTYGFTSPLWLLILAGTSRLGFSPLAASKILGAGFALLALVAAAALARRVLRPGIVWKACVMTMGIGAWSARWAFSGLETPMTAFFFLAALAARAWEKDSARSPVLSGVASGFACLSRPEGFVLAAILALDSLLTGPWRHAARRFALFAGVAGAVAVPWFLFARDQFGSWLPTTFAAKGGGDATVSASLDSLRTIAGIALLAQAPELIAIAWGLVSRKRERALRSEWFRNNWAWIAVLAAIPVLYAARGVVVLSRYLVPVAPLITLAAFASIQNVRSVGRGRPAALAWTLAGLSAAGSALAVALVLVPSTRTFDAAFETSLITMGQWLRANTPAGAVVAAADVGALGYYSDRRILDLFGIVSPLAVPEAASGSAGRRRSPDDLVESGTFLEMGHPDYLVDRSEMPERLMSRPALRSRLEVLMTRRAGRLTLRRPTVYWYTLYRILPAAGPLDADRD